MAQIEDIWAEAKNSLDYLKDRLDDNLYQRLQIVPEGQRVPQLQARLKCLGNIHRSLKLIMGALTKKMDSSGVVHDATRRIPSLADVLDALGDEDFISTSVRSYIIKERYRQGIVPPHNPQSRYFNGWVENPSHSNDAHMEVMVLGDWRSTLDKLISSERDADDDTNEESTGVLLVAELLERAFPTQAKSAQAQSTSQLMPPACQTKQELSTQQISVTQTQAQAEVHSLTQGQSAQAPLANQSTQAELTIQGQPTQQARPTRHLQPREPVAQAQPTQQAQSTQPARSSPEGQSTVQALLKQEHQAQLDQARSQSIQAVSLSKILAPTSASGTKPQASTTDQSQSRGSNDSETRGPKMRRLDVEGSAEISKKANVQTVNDRLPPASRSFTVDSNEPRMSHDPIFAISGAMPLTHSIGPQHHTAPQSSSQQGSKFLVPNDALVERNLPRSGCPDPLHSKTSAPPVASTHAKPHHQYETRQTPVSLSPSHPWSRKRNRTSNMSLHQTQEGLVAPTMPSMITQSPLFPPGTTTNRLNPSQLQQVNPLAMGRPHNSGSFHGSHAFPQSLHQHPPQSAMALQQLTTQHQISQQTYQYPYSQQMSQQTPYSHSSMTTRNDVFPWPLAQHQSFQPQMIPQQPPQFQTAEQQFLQQMSQQHLYPQGLAGHPSQAQHWAEALSKTEYDLQTPPHTPAAGDTDLSNKEPRRANPTKSNNSKGNISYVD